MGNKLSNIIILNCCKCEAEISHDGNPPALTRFDKPDVYNGLSPIYNNISFFIGKGWRGDGEKAYCAIHAKEFKIGSMNK